MANHRREPQVDIVVVGGGLAGMCAAIAAAENGASVTVLDRAYGGGSSAISAGVIYAGGGTKQQREAGYGDDTPENMYRYLEQEVGDAVDAPTLRRFCAESVSRMEWLESHGAKFDGSLCPYKTSYPTSEYFLYFSGNEKGHPFVNLAKPAPRGHRPVGKSSGGVGMGMTGCDLWQAIFDSAISLGVRFESASKVEELLVGEGRIKGVRYRAIDTAEGRYARSYKWLTQAAMKYQATVQILAGALDYLADAIWERGAREKVLECDNVILAAGGFMMNKRMVQQFIPWANGTTPLGTAGDDGSGIRLGQSIGGSVSHMGRMSAWRLIYPPEALVEGVIISTQGERIAAEDLYGSSFTDVMISQSQGRGFLILDSVQWEKARSQLTYQTQSLWKVFIQYLLNWAHQRAETLEDLSRKLKVDATHMIATVGAYNGAIINNELDPVGKLNHRSVIATAPFYGIDISLGQSGFLMTPALTLGGLRVDGESGIVLDDVGNQIPGLYAAGRNAVGICSNSYISGLSIADCVFSGKRAGEHAAKNRDA
ncbi:FAD binding domain-containing protein [Nemania diffusa]|nr:FAD binding domain-containing protein [Nemania diffusa]